MFLVNVLVPFYDFPNEGYSLDMQKLDKAKL